MNGNHQPRPEFVSYLQWQVQTAMQRRDRFSAPVRQGGMPVLRVAAIILVSVLCGAAGVLAREGIQDIKNKEILLAEVDGQIRLAELQLRLMRTRLQEGQEQHRNGLVGDEVVLAATLKCLEVESQVARLRLDREEISLTGKEPQNDLSAPLIGDRDFVTERISIDLSVAQEHASSVEKRLGRIRTLEEAGLIGAGEAEETAAESREASDHVRYLQFQLLARQRFIKGELTGEEVEGEVELNEARTRLELYRSTFEILRNRYARIKDLHERGAVGETELMRSQLELLEREVEIQLLQMRLRQLMSAQAQQPPPE